ncbi:FKBP-type peptidyl-prolyl cis-trans isomerase [Alteromonas confluentis]|uniref:FKBP-type peptidyl-prolyl cis-trans isomerase n=1 Tax=Alteromonas confluentis TaxID=1656094 RepID=UPI001B8B18C9
MNKSCNLLSGVNVTDKYTSVETQASYGVGFQMGEQLKSNPFEGLSLDAVLDGLSDAFNGQASQVDTDTLRNAFGEIHQRMQAAKAEQSKAVIEEGNAYLAKNAERDEVTVTESGLQYEIIEAGEGGKPAADSTVRVHYHGTLIDGSVFDSSYKRGQPAEFPVNGVIRGWTEALQLMPVGAKWKLYIPYDLAYGEQGAGGAIAPYSTLVFDVELLDILG